MEINTQHFKDLLTNELSALENQLKTLGRKNPDNPADWEATENVVADEADELEVADSMSTYENNRGTLNQLETRLNEVKKALGKIDEGTFGKCEVCGKDIETDRLEVNPSAPTCKEHME